MKTIRVIQRQTLTVFQVPTGFDGEIRPFKGGFEIIAKKRINRIASEVVRLGAVVGEAVIKFSEVQDEA